MIVFLIRLSTKHYYQNYFNDNSNDIRKTWEGIKSIINIHNLGKPKSPSLLIDYPISSHPKIIASTIIKYISSIASDLQGHLHLRGNDFTNYLN